MLPVMFGYWKVTPENFGSYTSNHPLFIKPRIAEKVTMRNILLNLENGIMALKEGEDVSKSI